MEEWELGKLLGKGAFSVVMRAQHRKTREKSAIKIVRRKVLSSRRQEAALRIEISVMEKVAERIKAGCKVSSKTLMAMTGSYEEESRFCLVLELLSGGELFDRIVGMFLKWK
jgi:calcium/calmodulin-dependent protein kinase I